MFKPGQSGNPGGRPHLSPDALEAIKMSKQDMIFAVVEIQRMTLAEAKQIDLDSLPLGKRAILNAYLKFDYVGISRYEDRIWGKAPESISITGENDGPIEVDITEKLLEKIFRNANPQKSQGKPLKNANSSRSKKKSK